MRYRIGICDDEISTCSEIETCIQQRFRNKSDSVEVFVWNSAESFINDVPEKTDLDILFLDIELPEKNGVDVGYYIRESMMNVGMHIIYISSKTSYALDLFDIHPYNFFVKPLSCEKICSEIEKLLQLDRQDKRFFTYIYNKSQYKVLYGNIIYLKSDKVQFTRDYTGQRSDGRGAARQIFHVIFKLSLVAAMVVIIKSTTRRLSSKDTFSQVSR